LYISSTKLYLLVYLILTGPAVVQATQVIAHVVNQEVDLIQLQKIGRKHLHCHLKHLLAVKQIESQVIIIQYNL